MSQTSLSVSCNEPGCHCFDPSGLPIVCIHNRNFDSGELAIPTSDLHSADVMGELVGFDSQTVSEGSLRGDAAFGTLSALVEGSNVAGGAYVLAGGLAISGNSTLHVSTEFADQLTVFGPAPGAAVSLAFTQSITSSESASVGSGSGVDPCLANGQATVLLNASLIVFAPLAAVGDLTQFARFGSACNPFQNTGSPVAGFTLNLHDGDLVNVGQNLVLDVSSSINGGLGPPSNPNRVLDAAVLLDASTTAKLFVQVLTPGASYTSASGTVYPVPEPGGALPAPVALAAALGLALRRRATSAPSCDPSSARPRPRARPRTRPGGR
jgi:hypothetical protein